MTNIEFASTTFTGSESSGEILVTVLASGATSTNDINVMISLTKGTTESKHVDCLNEYANKSI